MIGQGGAWIGRAFLLCPEEGLTSFIFWDDFCLRYVEGGDCIATPVLYFMPNVGDFDLCFRVEAAKVLDCEFP